jgi:hypothetical protein
VTTVNRPGLALCECSLRYTTAVHHCGTPLRGDGTVRWGGCGGRGGLPAAAGLPADSPMSEARKQQIKDKGRASSANKISLGKYENSVCHVASTVAVKIDYR